MAIGSPDPHRVLSSRLLLLALAWLGLVVGARAQDDDARFEAAFQEGIQAMTQGDHRAGAEAFERCLALRPEHSVSAYNLGCAHTLLGEHDVAFAWLDKAARWGFGDIGPNIAHAQRDPDLAQLRGDPRFAAFIEGMRERKKELEAYQRSLEGYWSRPAVHVPRGLVGREGLPLLVVLHDAGGRKEGVVSGPWRRLADELGLVLVAPSGTFPASRDPEPGMNWFDSLEGYTEQHWRYERTVGRAVKAVREEHDIDPRRVLLAGEGQGAMVAFNVAVTAPGLYRGVLALNGLPQLLLAEPVAERAGRMGFAARFVFDERLRLPRSSPSVQEINRRLEEILGGWGLATKAEQVEGASQPQSRTAEALARALRGLLEVEAAVGEGR